jgi:pilus assembly protein CpaB
MRRPFIFLFLAAVAAGLASMVVYSSLKQKDEAVRKALAGTTQIVVAAHDIALGAKIDSRALKLARWPSDGLPPAAITDLGSVIGSVARAEFVENEPIVASRLVAGDRTSGVLPLMIPSDMRAMSVAVDEVADMSGFVLPYTKVDVLLSLNNNDKEGGRSKIILQNISVLAVAQTVERKDNPEPERVVTLLVTPEQAERLAVASAQGKLQLALRSYGDNAIVPTAGINVHEVMGGYSEDVPPPPITIQSPPPSVPVRRFYRHSRPVPLQQVEVLRNGVSRQAVIIGSNGMAIGASGPAEPAADGANVPSAWVASLGNDNSDGSYGSGMGSMGGMAGTTLTGGVQ